MITDIYRIKTRNSVYEIHVYDQDGTANRPAACRKEGSTDWYRVSDFSGEFLNKLAIGASFEVPGVVRTSNVQDYVHLARSEEPKRVAKSASTTGIPEFFGMLAEHVKEQARDGGTRLCGIDGCTVERVPGLPSHEGSPGCKSGSVASGGSRTHCACDYCY